MNHTRLYAPEIPAFLTEFCDLPEMRRLRGIGMNCGCEYTSFPQFRNLQPYSRFDHSLGAALLVWRFTLDPAQTLSALFHDAATPVFAHVVDFLNGDALTQESTEAGTEAVLRGSSELRILLEKHEIGLDAVVDYHRYPIADNDAPRLSADRLEYTLGNLLNYGFAPAPAVKAFADDLTIAKNEDGMPELAFRQSAVAVSFANLALRCSKVYISDADRYAMQILSELLERAQQKNVLSPGDLMTTEREVIAKLCADPALREDWSRFRALHETFAGDGPDARSIPAKKRRIDPLVLGKGRVTALNPQFREDLEAFMACPLDLPVCGI